jgi:multidrug efflux pump subunit AcrB
VTLVELAVRRWQMTLLIAALLALLGIAAFLSTPRSVDPHFPIPTVVIVVAQPGADAADLEEAVARPIEDVLQGLDDIDRVRSRSADGISVITAEFSWSSDAEADYDEVVREITAIRGALPSGIRAIDFRKVRTTESALVQLALVSETASFRRLEKLAEDLRDRLNGVAGIRESEIYGLERPQVRVGLDTGRLAELGIPAESVADAIRSAGADLPVGAVHAGDRRLNVEAGGAFRSLEAIGAVPVRASGGAVVRIRDVASVAWAEPERDHITRLDGRRAVFVSATQKDRTNALETRAALEEVIEHTRATLPPDVSLQVGFDQTVDIRAKLAHLARDFAIALTLVLLTLLPLGWRASLVVMVSIPLSLGIGMIALGAAGFTLNQLAIAGFILALGLVVDDSIVVVENISRHIRSDRRNQADRGRRARHHGRPDFLLSPASVPSGRRRALHPITAVRRRYEHRRLLARRAHHHTLPGQPFAARRRGTGGQPAVARHQRRHPPRLCAAPAPCARSPTPRIDRRAHSLLRGVRARAGDRLQSLSGR